MGVKLEQGVVCYVERSSTELVANKNPLSLVPRLPLPMCLGTSIPQPFPILRTSLHLPTVLMVRSCTAPGAPLRTVGIGVLWSAKPITEVEHETAAIW